MTNKFNIYNDKFTIYNDKFEMFSIKEAKNNSIEYNYVTKLLLWYYDSSPFDIAVFTNPTISQSNKEVDVLMVSLALIKINKSEKHGYKNSYKKSRYLQNFYFSINKLNNTSKIIAMTNAEKNSEIEKIDDGLYTHSLKLKINKF
jgi:hypothetical protein